MLQGLRGVAGPQILSGGGAPTNVIGNSGDYFLDTVNSILYGPKNTGAWPATGINLIGGPGPATTLTIDTVTTLPPGSQATAQLTGASPNQKLSLGLPSGPAGATGNGAGNTTGPAGAVDGHIPLFDGTTGTILKDGLDPATLATTAALNAAVASVTAFPVSKITAKSTAFGLAPADKGTMFDLTGSFTITLPAASGATASAPLYFHFRKRDGSGACQIACSGGDTFAMGSTSISLYQEDLTLMSFGGAWYAPPGGGGNGGGSTSARPRRAWPRRPSISPPGSATRRSTMSSSTSPGSPPISRTRS